MIHQAVKSLHHVSWGSYERIDCIFKKKSEYDKKNTVVLTVFLSPFNFFPIQVSIRFNDNSSHSIQQEIFLSLFFYSHFFYSQFFLSFQSIEKKKIIVITIFWIIPFNIFFSISSLLFLLHPFFLLPLNFLSPRKTLNKECWNRGREKEREKKRERKRKRVMFTDVHHFAIKTHSFLFWINIQQVSFSSLQSSFIAISLSLLSHSFVRKESSKKEREMVETSGEKKHSMWSITTICSSLSLSLSLSMQQFQPCSLSSSCFSLLSHPLFFLFFFSSPSFSRKGRRNLKQETSASNQE